MNPNSCEDVRTDSDSLIDEGARRITSHLPYVFNPLVEVLCFTAALNTSPTVDTQQRLALTAVLVPALEKLRGDLEVALLHPKDFIAECPDLNLRDRLMKLLNGPQA